MSVDSLLDEADDGRVMALVVVLVLELLDVLVSDVLLLHLGRTHLLQVFGVVVLLVLVDLAEDVIEPLNHVWQVSAHVIQHVGLLNSTR